MPVAAITGKLRRRIWTDLGTAMGLGVSSAYAYW
jgi:cytochrome c oxidase subunit 7